TRDIKQVGALLNPLLLGFLVALLLLFCAENSLDHLLELIHSTSGSCANRSTSACRRRARSSVLGKSTTLSSRVIGAPPETWRARAEPTASERYAASGSEQIDHESRAVERRPFSFVAEPTEAAGWDVGQLFCCSSRHP